MSRGAAAPYIVSIINAVIVGIATMFLGLWLMDIQEKQSQMQAQIDTNASNLKKTADAYNQSISWRKQVAESVTNVNREVKKIESDLEAKIPKPSELKSVFAEEFEGVKQDFNDRLDQQIAELTTLVNTRATQDSMQVETGDDTAADDSEPRSGAIGIIEDSVAYDSIEKLARKSFVALYTLPPNRRTKQAVLVTDQSEVFFLDQREEILESAWTTNREKAHTLIMGHIQSEVRRDKQSFDAAILEVVPEDVLQGLQARNLSSDKTISVIYSGSKPYLSPTAISFTVQLKAGNTSERQQVQLPYHELPGLIEVPLPQ